MAWANQMQLMLCSTAALCRGATGVVLTHGLADTMLANSGDVVIGAEYTAIEGQAFKETAVTSVSFEAGGALISIGAQAFYGCSLLNGALQLPASLETIGVSAFQTKYSEALPNTGGVTSVTFAAAGALTSIGDRAFQGSHPADPGCTVYSTNVNGRDCGNNVATFASTASLADCAAAVDAASECGQHFERNRGSGRCSCLGPTTTCSESADGNVDRHIITKSCGQSLFMTYASTSLTNRRDPQDPAAAPSRRVFCGPACPLALSARLFACPSIRSPTLRVVSRLNITIR